MDGKQEIDIVDQDMKEIGFFWIFAKYIFTPLLIVIVGYFIYRKLMLVDFEQFTEIGSAGAVIFILILLLAISK